MDEYSSVHLLTGHPLKVLLTDSLPHSFIPVCFCPCESLLYSGHWMTNSGQLDGRSYSHGTNALGKGRHNTRINHRPWIVTASKKMTQERRQEVRDLSCNYTYSGQKRVPWDDICTKICRKTVSPTGVWGKRPQGREQRWKHASNTWEKQARGWSGGSEGKR